MEPSLDKIIKTYVINEFKYQRPERENGDFGKRKKKLSENEESLGDADEEYIDALHECLEKKGVLRELQAFLRQKMVLILQDKWPKLVLSPPTDLINPTVIKLLEDFLCSRRLLYTFSVLSSELGLRSSGKVKWRKMPFRDAEKLLEQMDIKKDSLLSRRILNFYSDKEDCSLLECIIHTTGWCDRPGESEEHGNLNLSKTNATARPQKLSARLKQIDEFFDKKQNTTEAIKNMGAEERFHAIERCLEDDKKIQLQLAIKKFKEEEVERIRDEMEHKMKFDMVAKENELLLNYKEKALVLKDNLEREKAVWLAEKSREERELEGKRQQGFEKATQVVTRPQDNFTELGGQSIPEKIEATDANLTKHYEKVDEFLMREAELRLAVKRLQEENDRLLIEKNSQQKHSIPIKSQTEVDSERRSSQKTNANTIQKVDTDTIAFLQYNLERQAEQIKSLELQLLLDDQKQIVSSFSNPKVSEQDSNDLISFLAESKRRCDQIEQDARSVDKKLQAIQTRRSRSSSPVSHPYQIVKPPHPGPYSTMSKLLIEQIQPLHRSQPQVIRQPIIIPGRPLPLRAIPNFLSPTRDPPPLDEHSWMKQISTVPAVPFDEDKAYDKAVHTLREIQHLQITENDSLHEGMNNSRSQERLHPTKPIAPEPTKTKSRTTTSTSTNLEIIQEAKAEENKIISRKTSDSEKVEKAVSKGALSFEKVSSDGESSRSSSIHQELSSRSRSRIKVHRLDHQGQQMAKTSRPAESKDGGDLETNIGEKADPEDISVEDRSLAISEISAAYEISHGGSLDLNDDFWKI